MGLIGEIWGSFRRLPVWVQLWVALILVPVNLVSLWFLAEPYGVSVAVLAVGGMMPNVVIMVRERGLSRAMALPHLVVWVPLLFVIALAQREGAAGAFGLYLWLLFAVDLLSLAFDFPDALRWCRGKRQVA